MRNKMILAAAGAVIAVVACGGAETTSDSNDHTSAVMEPIIGGVSATATYPEAALLDMTATNGSEYACSATLIAPKVVLTAGHCVDGMTSWDVYVGANHRTSTKGATYDWAENGATTVNPNHHDIGLVYLDEAITIASYPTLTTTKAANGSAALSVGRILNDTLTNSLYDAAITLQDGTSGGYPFDYVSSDVIQHGDSGGPVFLNGTHTLVAVNSGAGGTTQVVARVDLLSTWIQQQIAAHSASGSTAPTTSSSATPAPTTSSSATPAPTTSSSATPAPSSTGSATPSATCTSEHESNDTFATANAADAAECGKLSTSSDDDWFTLSAPVGTSTVTLAATGDAAMEIGYVSRSSCVFAVKNVKSVRVSATGTPAKLCAEVFSPKHATQTYRLTVSQ